jgi:hypothetical protein
LNAVNGGQRQLACDGRVNDGGIRPCIENEVEWALVVGHHGDDYYGVMHQPDLKFGLGANSLAKTGKTEIE